MIHPSHLTILDFDRQFNDYQQSQHINASDLTDDDQDNCDHDQQPQQNPLTIGYRISPIGIEMSYNWDMTNTKSYQQAIYEFINAYWQARGYAPTMKEIAAHIGLSRSSTLHHLELMRARGVIDWESHQQRSIRVIDKLK